MHKYLIYPMICLFLFITSNTFAHPHHSEAEAIASHGFFQVLIENAIYIVLPVIVALVALYLIRDNGQQSKSD